MPHMREMIYVNRCCGVWMIVCVFDFEGQCFSTFIVYVSYGPKKTINQCAAFNFIIKYYLPFKLVFLDAIFNKKIIYTVK